MARADSIYIIQERIDVGYLGPAQATLAAFTVKHEAQKWLRNKYVTYKVENGDVVPVKNFAGIRVLILRDGHPRHVGYPKVIELEHQDW